MTDYRRDEDTVTYKNKNVTYSNETVTYNKKQLLSDDIKAIQLICQKQYKEAIKLLVDLC